MCDVMSALRIHFISIDAFRKSLYIQKHAFYFRKVNQWLSCLCVSQSLCEHGTANPTITERIDEDTL